MTRNSTLLIVILCFGFAFLYIPILSMIVYSFNGSRLVTVWGGFSTKWYASLWSNRQVMAALVLSLKIALVSATIATILGTMAGVALARFRRFRGRTLFSGLVTAPLVMPEVITGISMLMMFILMAETTGWPGSRGFTTITLAHITFSMVFVTTIVHSRMLSADRAIEEAAMDLGSRPWQVMRDVTLPVISPAILSGWLLAFTISLDDVVITQFTTGPGNTTLPLLIWSKVKLGVTPDINALATLMVVAVGIGVAVAGYILHRSERRREKDARMAYRENAA
ncbi:MAG: ABC transporter permease subunit [Gemmobacter sp.]